MHGQLQEVELIPGGKEIKVTNANKDRYVQAILDWRTTGSVARQLRSLRNGFQEVLPTFQIREFTEEEMNLLLNGKQNFDVDECSSCWAQFPQNYLPVCLPAALPADVLPTRLPIRSQE